MSSSVEKKFNLNALTPLILDEKSYGVKTYLKSLKLGIDNEDIHNIALTGAYGSGKSSILKTFKNKYAEHNYINISLASFIEDKKPIGNDVDRLVELSVLQQLFYREDSKKTPYSRFRKIKNLSINELSIKSLIFSFFIIVTYLLINDSFIRVINPNNIIGVKVFLIILFLFGLHEILIEVFKVFNLNKINSINLKSFEVGLKPDDNQSILNKHLDEIIYFFEVTNYDVVFIEDLDRLESTFIFTKLREINQLVNNSKQINRTINFIYAVKDELFLEKESRTKFFDLIIPVIPVVNPYNSNDKAIEIINNLGDDYRLSSDFLNDICIYIDDMRLLNNICNEYVVYRKILSKKLNPERLFSMIVYKNLYSDDFALLSKNQGVVYKLINSKEVFRKSSLDKIDVKINSIQDKINDLHEEKLERYEDLKAIYVSAFLKKYPKLNSLQINDKPVKIGELYLDENFNEFKKNNSKIILFYADREINTSGSYVYFTKENKKAIFSELEKEISLKTFEERTYLLNKREINQLEEKISHLNKEKNKIKKASFYQVYRNVIINEKEMEDKKLIVYLLKNNFINEDYYDYISYFHGVSLSHEDNEYLQSIRSSFSPNYDYVISKPENFIKKLKNSTLEEESSFNNSLLTYLLINQSKHQTKLSIFLNKLTSYDEKSIKFIDYYFENGTEINLLINVLCSAESNFWHYIENRNYWKKTKDYYLELVVNNVSFKNITQISKTSSIIEFISKRSDFIYNYNDEKINEKIIKIITENKIKFKEVVLPENNISLFNYIYDNYHYEINIDNLKTYSTYYLKEEFDEKQFEYSNYSFLKLSRLNSLKTYIDGHLQSYIDNVFLKIENNKNNEESHLIEIINNPNIEASDIVIIINRTNSEVTNLTEIHNSSFIDELFRKRKIKTKWENIFTYYKINANEENPEEGNITLSLEEFLNTPEVYEKLANEERLYFNSFDIEERKLINNISTKILVNKNISNNSFWHLIHSVTEIDQDFNFVDLNREKVDILTRVRMKFSPDNYNTLRDKFFGLHVILISRFFEEFKTRIEECYFDSGDLESLIDSDLLDSENFLLLLDYVNNSDVVENKSLVQKIAKSLKDTEKTPFLIDFILLKEIFKSYNKLDDKIDVLNNYMNRMSPSDIIELFKHLPKPYSSLLQKNQRVKLEINPNIFLLAEKLKARDLISSYYVKNNYIKINMKRKEIT